MFQQLYALGLPSEDILEHSAELREWVIGWVVAYPGLQLDLDMSILGPFLLVLDARLDNELAQNHIPDLLIRLERPQDADLLQPLLLVELLELILLDVDANMLEILLPDLFQNLFMDPSPQEKSEVELLDELH